MILVQIQAPPPPRHLKQSSLEQVSHKSQQSAVRFCFSDTVGVSKQPGLRFVCLPKFVKDTIVADDDYKV